MYIQRFVYTRALFKLIGVMFDSIYIRVSRGFYIRRKISRDKSRIAYIYSVYMFALNNANLNDIYTL